MATAKIDLLVGFIERWLGGNSRRSLQALSRGTGVPYQTIRRLMQRETEPSLETSLRLLNGVGSLEETLAYFEGVGEVTTFYQRIAGALGGADLGRGAGEELERFWVGGVSAEGFELMKGACATAFGACEEIAREHAGDLVVCVSVAGKRVT